MVRVRQDVDIFCQGDARDGKRRRGAIPALASRGTKTRRMKRWRYSEEEPLK